RRDRRLVRDAGQGRTLARQQVRPGARDAGLSTPLARPARASEVHEGSAALPFFRPRPGTTMSVREETTMSVREGSLEAPTRHPIDWKDPGFRDENAALDEMQRVFDICHGCRRCVSLCNAFPTLFDLVDESSTMEVNGVDRNDYWKVVDQCYLCDVCYMTKCPYVPPHPWNLDFPHLMLRAKAIQFRQGTPTKFRDKNLSSTDRNGTLAGIPIVVKAVNSLAKKPAVRKQLEKHLGVHHKAWLPEYASEKFRAYAAPSRTYPVRNGERTPGKVAIYATCYINYNEPGIGHDLIKVLDHNEIPHTLAEKEACCGMPKLELGDLESVAALKEKNIPALAKPARKGRSEERRGRK